mmetsp:Transcript_5977/g.12183  ORF Transcript_5977/g.12183 Transcript_5977/m.12183 type:complete len:119 (-) Transcript_5977:874-1230(-)
MDSPVRLDGVPSYSCSQVPLGPEGTSSARRAELLKAAAAYSMAVKRSPTDSSLYSKRAWILLELSKVSKALADAEVIIELQPKSYLGHFLKKLSQRRCFRNCGKPYKTVPQLHACSTV